jgi:hypothetical protein
MDFHINLPHLIFTAIRNLSRGSIIGSYCSIGSKRQLLGKCSERYPNFSSWPTATVPLATIDGSNRCNSVGQDWDDEFSLGAAFHNQSLNDQFGYVAVEWHTKSDRNGF